MSQPYKPIDHFKQIIRKTSHRDHCVQCGAKRVKSHVLTNAQETTLMELYRCVLSAYKTSIRYSMRLGKTKRDPYNMSCNYVLYKLCELRGFADILPCIRMSMDATTVKTNDETWQHICKINNWEFFSTKIYE